MATLLAGASGGAADLTAAAWIAGCLSSNSARCRGRQVVRERHPQFNGGIGPTGAQAAYAITYKCRAAGARMYRERVRWWMSPGVELDPAAPGLLSTACRKDLAPPTTTPGSGDEQPSPEVVQRPEAGLPPFPFT